MNKKPILLSYPVSRQQLAQYYFPSKTVSSAVRRMRRWISDDSALRRDLQAVGCYPRQKWFNRDQVEVFHKYFG